VLNGVGKRRKISWVAIFIHSQKFVKMANGKRLAKFSRSMIGIKTTSKKILETALSTGVITACMVGWQMFAITHAFLLSLSLVEFPMMFRQK